MESSQQNVNSGGNVSILDESRAPAADGSQESSVVSSDIPVINVKEAIESAVKGARKYAGIIMACAALLLAAILVAEHRFSILGGGLGRGSGRPTTKDQKQRGKYELAPMITDDDKENTSDDDFGGEDFDDEAWEEAP